MWLSVWSKKLFLFSGKLWSTHCMSAEQRREVTVWTGKKERKHERKNDSRSVSSHTHTHTHALTHTQSVI